MKCWSPRKARSCRSEDPQDLRRGFRITQHTATDHQEGIEAPSGKDVHVVIVLRARVLDELRLNEAECRRFEMLIESAAQSGLSHLTLIEDFTGPTNLLKYFKYLQQGIEKKGCVAKVNVLDEGKFQGRGDTIKPVVTLIPRYRGKADVVEAIKAGAASGASRDIEKHLLLGAMPEPDLLVFPGGDKVIGDVGVWIGAYSEFAFLEQPWHCFTGADLEQLLEDLGMRNRRFGAV